MIPLLPEEYFEHELCVQCGSIVYEPYYIHVAHNKTITMGVVHVFVNIVHGKVMKQNPKKTGQVIVM